MVGIGANEPGSRATLGEHLRPNRGGVFAEDPVAIDKRFRSIADKAKPGKLAPGLNREVVRRLDVEKRDGGVRESPLKGRAMLDEEAFSVSHLNVAMNFLNSYENPTDQKECSNCSDTFCCSFKNPKSMSHRSVSPWSDQLEFSAKHLSDNEAVGPGACPTRPLHFSEFTVTTEEADRKHVAQ